MKISRLIVLTAFWLIASSTSATITNGIRQKPVPTKTQGFVASANLDEYYYLYNTKAKAFFTEGNSWGTQASLGDYGLPVAFTADSENAGAYLFNDFAYTQGSWKLVFFDSKQEMFVDWNNQPNYRWGVQDNGETFRLYASDKGNPGWNNGWWGHEDCYEADRYVGIVADSETTALSPFLSVASDHYIDWVLVTSEDYYDFLGVVGIYNEAEELRALIETAQSKGIETSAQQAVYLNENATADEIYEALETLEKAISDWENSQASQASVKNPYDLTSRIVNPDFANDDVWTGWSGTDFGAYNPNENAEHYNKTYDTFQTITGLPAGIYSVGVKAFYRAGDAQPAYDNYKADNEQSRYARLYATCGATTCQEPIVSPCTANMTERVWVGDESTIYDNETGETYYIPNNMVAAEYYMHTLGYYDNHVLVPVDETGELTIGVRKTDQISGDWSLFDDFTLTYYGNGTDAQELYRSENTLVATLELNSPTTTLLVGETLQFTATITPENAKQKTLLWESDNQQVATVDAQGLVTAEGAGTATISATTTDGTNITRSVVITVKTVEVDANGLIINEIMASNVDEFISPAFNFDGWIELYNNTEAAFPLAGLYMSDDATNLKKWRMPTTIGVLPAKGFKVIWFDSNDIAPQNAPFKLDVDGGTIYISDTSGQLIASQTYPAGKERVSYARTTDGGSTWGLTDTATPEASNNPSKFADVQLAAPVVDQPSQLFSGALSVNVTIPAGCTLRYTTDGSLPTADNGETSRTGQFSVGSTSIYRFRLFAEGQLASAVTSRSYIYKDRDYYLPVVSVVGDDRFFNSTEIGVFQKGPNGRPGNGQDSKCNWNMNWERPVNFSYLDADGEMVLNQDVNLEMCGGWSRAWLPHAFKLKGNKELGGNKHLPYPFFTQKPYIRNRTLQVRNGGNDNNARFKDPALQYLVMSAGVNLDCQSYQPVHEFINGEYIGVLNVREPNNKHYVYANYGWDDDEIDQFEMSPDSAYVQKCGTADAYNELVDVLSEDAANSETYEEIRKLLDVDSYANYMAAQLYLGNWDWPQNNVKGFRHRDGGKFRFVLFDLDGSFNTSSPFDTFFGKEYYTFDQLKPASLGRLYNEHIRFVTLFRNLLRNADFRRRFIDAYCIMGGSVFEASRAASIISELEGNVRPAMSLEGRQGSLSSTANSVRNSLAGRLSTAINALWNCSDLELKSSRVQNVTLGSDTEGAQLLINGMQVPTGAFKGSLFAPATLKAVAPAGYAFQGWTTTSGETTLLANGSKWSYYDQGSLDGQNWTSPTYAANGWSQGTAPLGYGKDGVSTTLDYGSDSRNKRPTAYFRATVTLAQAPKSNDSFTLNFTVDDGIIVYVNGTEAGRYNMPSGTVSYNQYATSYAPNNPDTGEMTLSASLFRKGSNTIAVELHNNNATSTDLLWDAEITTTASTTEPTFYATEPEIALPSGTVKLTASYRPLTESELAEQGISPVRINEISGSNNSLVNDYFKKNDWIELYNTTDSEIDVEGMYLTDNLEKPEKYQITKGSTTASTKIAAHGYLIIWCDKLATTSQALHASFKISGEGGALQLMAADKSWKDVLYYDAHDANHTVGRYPDGSADVYVMDMPTIAGSNMLTSYLTTVEQQPEITRVKTLVASANGFRLRYGAGQLIVKNETDGPATIYIYTTDGRLIERQNVEVKAGTARLSVGHLPQGFYVARATNSDDTRVACKFMK